MNFRVLIPLFITLFISNVVSSQIKFKLKLKNDSMPSEYFKQRGLKFISLTNKTNKIKIEDVKEITIYHKKKIKHFTIVKSENNNYGLGSKIYSDNKIEAYHANFSLDPKATEPITEYRPRREVFAKKRNENKFYSIGALDGYGWKNIEKRLLTFFKDCPELFDEMLRRKIYAEETLKILQLHSELCGQ